MPIGVYAGLEITGASVQQAVTRSDVQAAAVLALHERFHTDALLTAMDLSVEAEVFGCEIRISDDEVPTVMGRLVNSAAEIAALPAPKVGEGRTAVQLETTRRLVDAATGCPVLGGLIGPFSLAGRLFGVSESMELSLTDPDLLEELLGKVTRFLAQYVEAFRRAGAAGVIMAEPAAGLLSPRGLGRFSSPFVRQVIEQNQSEDFTLILHNCGARLVHLPKILEAGAEIYHFGAPMDMRAALSQVEPGVILGGNLDPAAVFHGGTPAGVAAQTRTLLEETAGWQNFIISSGCDIPPQTPAANLEAFYRTVREFSA